MERNWKIAIIDRGVDKNHSRLNHMKINGLTIFKDSNSEFSLLENEFGDSSGHGTAIAGIIHKLSPDIELFSIKLHSHDDSITEDLLIQAIKWCIMDKHIRLINVSLGIAVQQPSPELFEACKDASDNGKILIASAYNFPGTSCYPAHLPFVYGVSCGIVKNKTDYAYLGPGHINILAKGTTQRVAWVNNSFRITTGTSFATAHFTGILCRLLADKDEFTREEVRDLVESHSNNEVPQLYYVKKTKKTSVDNRSLKELDEHGRLIFGYPSPLAFATKLCLFPASEKEIRTIAEFPHACPVKISFFVDYPRKIVNSFFAGKNYGQVKILNRDLTNEEYGEFDTMVVGYFLDQYVDANILFGINLIKKCLSCNKNFIIWDLEVHQLILEMIKEGFQDYTGHILFPSVDDNALEIVDDFQHLPRLKLPVLAVIGTGSMQGKITTQLRIKELLTGEGYRIFHFTTEPQAILLGADHSFPYGFKSIVHIRSDDWGPYLNVLLRGIQKYRAPHLILTGTQGGVLPRYRLNDDTSGNILSTMQFLLGINPDAIICTINPMDSIELINQTLQTVNSFCKAPALFCVMTPWSRKFIKADDDRTIASYKVLSEEDLSERVQEYSQKLGLPVFNIMDATKDDEILNVILNYFAKK